MWPLFKKTFTSKFGLLIGFTILSTLFVLLYVGIFPSMSAQAENFDVLLQAYPEAFLKVFAIDANSLFVSLEPTVASYHFSMIWPLMMIVMAVMLALGLFASEIENRSIETLLALPVSRAKIFIAKYLAGAALMVIFTLISAYVTIPFAAL